MFFSHFLFLLGLSMVVRAGLMCKMPIQVANEFLLTKVKVRCAVEALERRPNK